MELSESYILILLSFVIAGAVKGLIGLGFPTIILAILSLTIGVRDAMAIMLLPCFLTNVWQAVSGGNLRAILKRIWPLLFTACLAIWITTAFIAAISSKFLSILLGVVVLTYATVGLATPQLALTRKHESWMTPVIGCVNGTITGLTGTFVVPGVLYLQSLQLGKDRLIQAMGVLFLVSTTALGSGLFSHNLLNNQFILLSAVAIIPSFVGMAIGQLIRKSMSEKDFRKIFFTCLLLLGGYIILRNIL